VRLYHRGHSRYDPEQLVHEEVQVPGRLLPLHGTLLHWRGQSFIAIARVFVRYADIEAEALDRRGVRASWTQMIGRTLARFAWVYVVKGYFRLGTRGLMYATLKANSEFLRYARLWERQHLEDPVLDPPPEELR
jgi:hypothetical protein